MDEAMKVTMLHPMMFKRKRVFESFLFIAMRQSPFLWYVIDIFTNVPSTFQSNELTQIRFAHR